MNARPRANLLATCAATLGPLAVACSAADPAAPLTATPAAHCLPDASGFLRAQLHGAIDVNLDWHDADIRCEGGPRPDGEGLRVSIAGPLPASAGANAGRTLRFVFGIEAAAAVTEGTALATNLTAILESGPDTGEPALFATRGDGLCTIDRLQRRGEAVEARGFCLGPANSLDGESRLLVTTFDFAGRVSLDSP